MLVWDIAEVAFLDLSSKISFGFSSFYAVKRRDEQCDLADMRTTILEE